MRRRFKGSLRGNRRFNGPSTPHAPKTAKPAKVALPKGKELAIPYSRFVSAEVQERVAALAEAIQWWDAAMLVYLAEAPLSPEDIKSFDKATKARQLAIHGTTDDERETGFLRTVEIYEKIWADKYNLPRIKDSRATLAATIDQLKAEEVEFAKRFEDITNVLNTAFSSFGVSFVVSRGATCDREFDGFQTISLSANLCKALAEKRRKEGTLSLLLSEAYTVLKASGFEHAPDGTAGLNYQKAFKNVPNMFAAVMAACASTGGKVLKHAPATVQAAGVPGKVKAIRTPSGAPRAASTGPRPKLQRGGQKVGGKYVAGSAMAILYERLEDQASHPVSEILAGLSVGNPMDRLKWLVKHGEETKRWTVVIAGNTVQMTIH